MIWSSSAAPGDEWADAGLAQDPWSRVRLAGQWLPGSAEIVGADVGRKIDLKAPQGSGGGTITDRGPEPSRFGIKVTIWTEAQFEVWRKLVPSLLIRPKGGGISRWPIEHPSLDVQGIRDVVIERIGSLQSDSKGAMVAELRCIQWLPPKPGNKTKTIKPTVPPLTNLDPNAPNYTTASGETVNRPVPPSQTDASPNFTTASGEDVTVPPPV